MEYPKVIFLDAVGTLFGVRGSVGEVYGAIADQFGVHASSTALQSAFVNSFKQSSPMLIQETTPEKIAQQEYEWWSAIARSTFEQLQLYDQFSDFPSFFETLFHHFATADPWYVYSDVPSTLASWQNRGIELGIISNFDSRVQSVLKALELQDFFTSVTISSHVGAVKPEPKIFHAALAKHECEPNQAWHIGDSLEDDYYGAKAVGMRGFLIQRSTSQLQYSDSQQSS